MSGLVNNRASLAVTVVSPFALLVKVLAVASLLFAGGLIHAQPLQSPVPTMQSQQLQSDSPNAPNLDAALLQTGFPNFAQSVENETEPKTPVRHIYVPLDSLNLLLEGNSNRVLIDRSEYEELLAATRTRELKRAPLDSAILSAKYSGEIADDVATIKGELVVERLNDGMVEIPLPFSGVTIRSATMGDQPANLWRNQNGQIVLLTTATQRETLKLEMLVPVSATAARQSLSLQLPAPSATEFELTVPGNVEVKSGAAVVERTYDETADTTKFDLLPTRAPLNLVMSLNNRLLKDDQVIVSRSVLIHKLSPTQQEIHLTSSLDVIHGATEEVEFEVPDGFEVSDVVTELLDQWQITGESDARRLQITLREPTREPIVLSITAIKTGPLNVDWKSVELRPVNVAGMVSLIGVLADVELESSELFAKGVISIDHESLLAALPSTLNRAPRQRPLNVVAAYYAPQADYSVSAKFSQPDPELIVKSSLRLNISDLELRLDGGLAMRTRHDARFDFRLQLPADWRLNEITNLAGQSIAFERVSAKGDSADSDDAVESERSEFLIRLPARMADGDFSAEVTKLFFKATHTPKDWLENWETNSLDFPLVTVVGQTEHTGTVQFSTDEDLILQPTKTTGLELRDDSQPSDSNRPNSNPAQNPVQNRDDERLAYQFDDSNFMLSLDVSRKSPKLTAQVIHFYRLAPEQIEVHAELEFSIREAAEDTFEFELPLDSPESISIRAKNVPLKNQFSTVTETGRLWTVRLATPQTGTVLFLVDYTRPISSKQLAKLELTPIRVQKVNFQTSLLAVEGSSELDIDLKTSARPVDVGELSKAEYQPGRRLLGAFAAGDDWQLTLSGQRRPVYELPAAIVQRAEMVTSVSSNGTTQTAARFLLAVKQQPFLRIELPPQSTLWSVMVDGQPAKPQRLPQKLTQSIAESVSGSGEGAKPASGNGGSASSSVGETVIVSLPDADSGKLRDVQLVYESQSVAFNLVGKIVATAPRLWLIESGTSEGMSAEKEAQSAEPIPLVDLQWRLLLPHGFSVAQADEHFQSAQMATPVSPLRRLGDWVFRLGGGFQSWSSAKEAARRPRSSNRAFATSDSVESFTLDNSIPTDRSSGDPLDSLLPEDLVIEDAMDYDEFELLETESGEDAIGGRGLKTYGETANSIPTPNVSGRLPEPTVDPKPSSGKSAEQKQLAWALSGLRSLNINLTETGNSVAFYNLGEQRSLRATLIHQTRADWIGLTFAVLVALAGVLLTRHSGTAKLTLLAAVLLIASLCPLLGSRFVLLQSIVDSLLLAVVLLLLFYFIHWMGSKLVAAITNIGARLTLIFCVLAFLPVFSNVATAQEIISDAHELKRLIAELQSDKPVAIPDDAIIVPYDSTDPQGTEKAKRLLLPYAEYLRLMQAAKLQNEASDPTKPIDAPTEYVLSSSEYSLTLELENDVAISGKLNFELFTDGSVTVALPLAGGALSEATVNGQPAKLQLVSGPPSLEQTNQPVQVSQQAAPVQAPIPSNANPAAVRQQQLENETTNLFLLHLSGRGKKTFAFTLQCKPNRQGGWRNLQAQLPFGLTRGLNLKSGTSATEVRLLTDADQRTIELKPKQNLASVLDANGGLKLAWKPSSAKQAIDQSLTAQSEALFDIREDGLRLNWHVTLEFRGSQRDAFSLQVPAGFLVEAVRGENIRAWDSKDEKLEITLLAAATDRESFSVELSRRDFALPEPNVSDPVSTKLTVPYVNLDGASLHQGTVQIRRSPIIELKTGTLSAVQRIENQSDAGGMNLAEIDAKSSPLGIENYQLFQFIAAPFQIVLDAHLLPRTFSSEVQSIIRVGQSEATMESKINIEVGARPLHSISFTLPKLAKLKRLVAGKNESWSTKLVADRQRVQLFFPAGVTDNFSIILETELKDYQGAASWKIPVLQIDEAEIQSSEIAIQVDPAFRVSASELKNCETVLVKQFESWLIGNQMTQTRLALRSKVPEYAATLQFQKIEPRVSVETVTNVRTTSFAIEETILLDFEIKQAGIRQIEFEIPATMKHARFLTKLVRERAVKPVSGNPDWLQVTLNLQDDVIDSYRVVIENDRPLASGGQAVPVPRVKTGVTENQFVTLQNAGRDEIAVLESRGFQAVNRQLKQFADLKQKLAGGEVTMAYVLENRGETIVENDVAADANVRTPAFFFETKQREIFDTVAASIEFSKTTMVVDSSGAYRALQNFQVNNRSEQYLEIKLPAGARLLTVVVDGSPVKPVAWPSPDDRRLRIPLVKTQLGELDYPVQLKFAGSLGEFSNLSTVAFPVIETLNINVQLSQLHLRLPETHRWIDFAGTMTKVDDRGGLEESFLAYNSRQIQQLAEQLRSESSLRSSSYSKKRAYENLERLKQDLVEMKSKSLAVSDGRQSGQRIEGLVKGNEEAIEQAQNFYIEVPQGVEQSLDNRANLNTFFDQQQANISRNAVTKDYNQNFSVELEAKSAGEERQLDIKGTKNEKAPNQKLAEGNEKPQGQLKSSGKNAASFDGKWLERNQLSNDQSGQNRFQGGAGGQSQFGGGVGGGGRGVPDLSDAPNSPLPPGLDNEGDVREEYQVLATQLSPQRKLQQDEIDIDFQNPADQSLEQSEKKGSETDLDGVDPFAPNEPGDNLKFGDGGFEQKGQAVAPAEAGERGPQSQQSDARREKAAELRLTGITSLDIELPSRGVDYYFKSPRGNATVTVRLVQHQSISRWFSVLGILVIVVAAWGVAKLMRVSRVSGLIKTLLTLGLLLAGLVSLTGGILPIYGLLAILAATILFIDWLARPAATISASNV